MCPLYYLIILRISQHVATCCCFRYDVWLVDWRASCDLPWAVYQDYTLDDCAAYDYPAAIDKVLEITQQVSKEVESLPCNKSKPHICWQLSTNPVS